MGHDRYCSGMWLHTRKRTKELVSTIGRNSQMSALSQIHQVWARFALFKAQPLISYFSSLFSTECCELLLAYLTAVVAAADLYDGIISCYDQVAHEREAKIGAGGAIDRQHLSRPQEPRRETRSAPVGGGA